MDTILGLFGIVVWIAIVIAIAAVVTYAVVKISPAEKKPREPHPPQA